MRFKILLATNLACWAAQTVAQPLPTQLTLTNISIQGQPRTLVLTQRSVRAPNFHYLTWTSATGYQTNVPPPVRTYRGTRPDQPNTIVCAIIKPGGLLKADGFDSVQGKSYTWSIDNVNISSQLPAGAALPAAGMTSGAVDWENPASAPDNAAACGCATCDGALPPAPAAAGGISLLGILPPSTYMPPAGGMQQLDLGVDLTHYRYAQTYGGNADLAVASIEHTVNLYDFMMARDALISVQESVLVLRQEIFYVPTGMGNHLNLMTTAWKTAPLAALPWDQIHSFATEQGLFGAGGYAWGDNIGKDESPANVEALYHEAGHNWDVVHLVYGRDTMGGNHPNHGPFSMDRLLRKRSESMSEGDLTAYPGVYPDPLPPFTHVDCASVVTNSFVDLNVLTNDWDGNGDALTVTAFSTNTPRGGSVTWISNGVLRYAPAPDYVGKDLFTYTVQDSTGLQTRDLVHVEVINRNLTLHYAFEQSSGKNATDSTSHGHPGRLQGATDFSTSTEPGVVGQALRVDSGGVICDASPLVPPDLVPVNSENFWPFDTEALSRGNFFDPMDESFTAAFWFKSADVLTTRSLLRKEWHDEQKVGFNLRLTSSGLSATVREFNGLSAIKTLLWSSVLTPDRWYHVALQFDRTANQARLYVNGVVRASAALDANRFIFQGRVPLLLGADAGGLVAFDEFRLYTKALSAAELLSLYQEGQLPASAPSPANGEFNTALAPALTWLSGRTNYQHDVFFGTNFSNVASATTNSPTYAGRLNLAAFAPGTLAPNTTYFWRVDEIWNGTNVAPGEVWQFTTAVEPLQGGMRVHLPLDARDTAGTLTYDRAGPPFEDSTRNGNPPLTNGQCAEAFEFNGTSQFVQIPALNLSTDTLTLLGWVRRNGTVNNNAGIIFHRGPSVCGLNVTSANQLGYHWNDAANTYNFSSGLTLPNQAWALVAVVIEPHRAIIYLGTTNGLLAAATNNVAHGPAIFDTPLRLASDSTSSSRYFKGAMDEVGIWNRALSRAEIGTILTNGLAGFGVAGAPPPPAPGTYSWSGAINPLWSEAANWSSLAVPGAANRASFDASATNHLNTELDGNQTIAGLLATGGNRLLGVTSAVGKTLTIGASGVTLTNTAVAFNFAAPVTLATNQTWYVGDFATLTIASNISGAGRTLDLHVQGQATNQAIFSGAGALLKNGAGPLALTAPGQTFTGGLILSNGIGAVLGGAWANSFFANVSPRTITAYSNATLLTTTHSLGGLGGAFYAPTINLFEGATWRLEAEQYLPAANLVLRGATVFITSADLRLQAGTLAINAAARPTTITGGGRVTLYGNTTFNVANGPLPTDASINVPIGSEGVAALTKTGLGTLALGEPVTYTGNTIISAGTLSLRGGKDTLPQAMTVSVTSGSTLDLNNNDQTLASLTGAGNVSLGFGTLTLAQNSIQSFGGSISGSPVGTPPASGNTEESPNPGGLTKSGTGRWTLTGIHTFTGDTLISAGTLALSGSGQLAGTSNIVVRATFDVSARTGGNLTLQPGQKLSGNGTVIGGLVVSSNAWIAPGEGLGLLTTASQTWAAGGGYEWDITDANNAGSADRLLVNGTLTISASAAAPFTIKLQSPAGALPGFNAASNSTWLLATTTNGLVNFSPDKFAVDATGLGVDLAGGTFIPTQSGNELRLAFQPYTAPTTPPGFTAASFSNQTFTLSVTGAPGQIIYLHATTNLNPAVWQLLNSQTVDLSGSLWFTDPTAPNHPRRFYRTSLQP